MPRSAKNSLESRIDEIRAAFQVAFNPNYELDLDVRYTFDDAVMVKEWNSRKFYEIAYSQVGDDIQFGEAREVEQLFVLKRITEDDPGMTLKQAEDVLYARKGRDGAELTGPIVFKNTAERIAFAAVLVPGEPDLDYDKGEKILTKEEVEAVANGWLSDYANIDLLHSLNNVAVPVQSYTTYSERTVKVNGEDLVLPEGTWIMGSRIDETIWPDVESGKLTGYSVMGIKKAALKTLIGAMKSGDTKEFETSLKKTLLKDLGPDWIAPFVSIVDTPAVPKSKWFALKSATPEPAPEGEPEPGLLQRLIKLFDSGSKRSDGRTNKEVEDMTPEEIKVMVEEAVKASASAVIQPVLDRVDAMEKAFKALEGGDAGGDSGGDAGGDPGASGDSDGTSSGDPAGGDEVATLKGELESLKSAMDTKLGELEKRVSRKGRSNVIQGQDDGSGGGDAAGKSADDDDEENFGERDSFGRARKSK